MHNYVVIKKLRIEGDFQGFDEDMLFKLSDGSFWIQTSYKYWYSYAYFPLVHLLKSGNFYALEIVGTDEIVEIRQIYNVIESQIDGDFEGWDGDTEYELTNGQIWKQSTYSYEYQYSYRPDVIIYETDTGYKMNVEGTSVEVERIF